MKEDLRSIKTINLIEQTFLELLKEKGYQRTKVIDIANRALISRKTFYFHYATIEHLYNSLIDKYISLLSFSDVLSPRGRPADSEFLSAVIALLERAKEKKEIYRILMNDPTNNRFNEHLKTVINESLTNIQVMSSYLEENSLPDSLIKNIYVAAVFETFKWWIEQDHLPASHAACILLTFSSAKLLDILGVWSPENKSPS